uniref:Uncharacterized protein n=1 Tax=Oryza barthii TaxID=65489 RepID=A0A0D3G0G4_9ORYZ
MMKYEVECQLYIYWVLTTWLELGHMDCEGESAPAYRNNKADKSISWEEDELGREGEKSCSNGWRMARAGGFFRGEGQQQQL